MNLNNYECERSFASASKLEDMLLEFQFEMELNNASGHTEATMETSYTSTAGDCFDDPNQNDPETKPSHYIDTNTYARPRTYSDSGAAFSSCWSSYHNNLRHSSLLPMYGIAAEVTNSPPTPCCGYDCTCCSIDDPLLYRPIQEVQATTVPRAIHPPEPRCGLKRDRSNSQGRSRNHTIKHHDPVSDLKFDGLRVSPPSSPGAFALSAKHEAPLGSKVKHGFVSVKNFAAGISRGKKRPEPDLVPSKAEKTPTKNLSVSSCTTSTTMTTSTSSSSLPTATTSLSTTPSPPPSSATPKKRIRRKEPTIKVYVKVEELDVLLGRGGHSNLHHGNVVYRRRVLKDQPVYKTRDIPGKQQMSEDIAVWVKFRGGRFLARDDTPEGNGRYYEVTPETARLKVSQALREDHTPEGRELKKSRRRTAKHA